VRQLGPIAAALLAGVWLASPGGAPSDIEPSGTPGETTRQQSQCPFCGTAGILLPNEASCGNPECLEYLKSKNVPLHRISRIAVGDCSLWECAEDGTKDPVLLYLDLPLYRCPRDGLLFTRPDPE